MTDMSMLSAQCDELRQMAESVGLAMPQAATLMMEAADTTWELRGSVHRERAEADRLRERITTQKQTIQAYRDESREWREVAERVQAENDKLRNQLHDQQDTAEHNFVRNAREYKRVCDENAKLRELARELWDQAEQNLVCDENCPYGAACDWMESDVVCVFKRRMRELGVEVDG